MLILIFIEIFWKGFKSTVKKLSTQNFVLMPEMMPSVKSVAKLWMSRAVGFDLWALELSWQE